MHWTNLINRLGKSQRTRARVVLNIYKSSAISKLPCPASPQSLSGPDSPSPTRSFKDHDTRLSLRSIITTDPLKTLGAMNQCNRRSLGQAEASLRIVSVFSAGTLLANINSTESNVVREGKLARAEYTSKSWAGINKSRQLTTKECDSPGTFEESRTGRRGRATRYAAPPVQVATASLYRRE